MIDRRKIKKLYKLVIKDLGDRTPLKRNSYYIDILPNRDNGVCEIYVYNKISYRNNINRSIFNFEYVTSYNCKDYYGQKTT